MERIPIFFFFKQKTAYEIMPSLVGSEMCIRDSRGTHAHQGEDQDDLAAVLVAEVAGDHRAQRAEEEADAPVSYTHLTLPTIYSV
ncbi:hypothetical protein BN3590_00108 [Clostridium sp. C105KSO15]|nr:hypothetical protein BN3590_00108 [Clostridium sp. C105KSO15]